MNADQMWRQALVRNHEAEYAIGQRYVDLLVTLLVKGPGYGSELMRRIGDTHQPNTVRRLQRMDALGFVASRDVTIVALRGGSTTTSRAVEWRLTRRGRELAQLLVDEARASVSALMRGREYWPTEAGLAAVAGVVRKELGRRRVSNSEIRYWPVSA